MPDPFRELATTIRHAARREARLHHDEVRGTVVDVDPLTVDVPSRALELVDGEDDDFEAMAHVVAAAEVGDAVILRENATGWIATGLLKE